MVHESLQNKPDVGTSQFNMIRCVIAMAHADGEVCKNEREMIDTFKNNLAFTEEQISIIHGDLTHSKTVDEFIPFINDPSFRSQIVYFARLMAYKDGQKHPKEEELLKYLYIKTTENIDMEGLKAEIHKQVEFDLAIHDDHMDLIRPDSGMFWFIDQLFLNMGIDLLA